MKKQISRRRLKARLRLGKKVAWCHIVNQKLTGFAIFQHSVYDHTVFIPIPRFYFASGSQDFLRDDVQGRRWMPLEV